VLALGVLPVAAQAHRDDPKALNPAPPYEGPGYAAKQSPELAEMNAAAAYSGAAGVQVAGGTAFPAQNVELLSWVSLADFDLGSSMASVWGYTSPSGREYAICPLRSGTAFVEVTDPTNPRIVGSISGTTNLWRDAREYQGFVYVGSESGEGVRVIDIRNLDDGLPSLVRTINTPSTGRTHTIEVDRVNGFLYRAGGLDNGLRIYSLADPGNPQFVASWSLRYVHEVTVVSYDSGPYAGKQIAFCCSGFNGGFEETGLEILDVTNKQNIVQLGRIVYPGGQFSHQVWLSKDRKYAYLNDELDEQRNGLPTTTLIFNVENLSNPTLVGSFHNSSPAVGHNLYVRGDFIYEANYTSGLRVFRATNPLAPTEVAWFDTAPTLNDNSFNGAWSCYPFFQSGIVLVSDMQRGLFVLRVTLPAVPGDLNCDGVVSVSDIGHFVSALTNPAAYHQANPVCDIASADINGDGNVTVSDIAGFVNLLTGAP
jgi:choice-of-anchor B domain-containing protein